MLTSPMIRAGLVATLAIGLMTYAFDVDSIGSALGWAAATSLSLPIRLAPALLFALYILAVGSVAVRYPVTSSLAPLVGLTYRFWRYLSGGGGPAGTVLVSSHDLLLDPLHLVVQFVVAGAVARCVASVRSSDPPLRPRRHQQHMGGIRRLLMRIRAFSNNTSRAVKGWAARFLRMLLRFLARADAFLLALEDRHADNDDDEVADEEDASNDDEDHYQYSSSDDDDEVYTDDDEEYIDEEDDDEEEEEEGEVGEVVIHRGGRTAADNDVEWVVRRYVFEAPEGEVDGGGEKEGDEGHNDSDADGPRQQQQQQQQPPPPDGPPENDDEGPPREEGGMDNDVIEEIVDSDDEKDP
jgi:hypothetical protein